MSDPSSCPGPAVLQRWTIGQVSAAEAEPLQQHLSECQRCVETLQGLKPDDTLTAALRGGAAVLERLENDEVRGLIRRLEAASPSGGATVAAEAPDKELADLASQLTDYRVVKRLGAGGMGVVYLVENVKLGRMEALKVMRPVSAENKEARQRFLREAQAMAMVRHEHVATVFHVMDGPETPFLTMEFLEGEALEDRLRRERRPPTAERAALHSSVKANTCLAFSRDGALLASYDGDRVSLWDAASDDPLREWKLPNTLNGAIAFAPDGRHLAATSYNGAVYIFRLPAHAAGVP